MPGTVTKNGCFRPRTDAGDVRKGHLHNHVPSRSQATLRSTSGPPNDAVHGVKSLLNAVLLGLVVIALSACGGMPAPAPWSDSAANRLELGSGVVVTFVEGLTPEMLEKVAYITHVASGSQAILNSEGKVVQRRDGRADGASRLDTVLSDGATVALVMQRLSNGGDVSPRPHTISWVPLMQFGGIQYVRKSHSTGEEILPGERDLAVEDLGPELYRVAFRGNGYAGPYYRYQDGDATYLNPGTQVYAVKGYSPEFRLGTLEEGKATLYEVDTNPFAKTGGDLLDIQGKVTAIDILKDDHAMTILGTIDDEQAIEKFVGLVLEASVDQSSRDHNGPRYFLGIRLADGTSVVRPFWLETGELSRGIMTGPETASIVSDTLQTNQGQDDLLTPEEAKTEGLAQARIAGLVGEPTSTFATLTSLAEYVETSSYGTGNLSSEAASVGLHPDTKVWVVAFRGPVKLTLPSSGGKTSDNITLALDARTGEIIRAYAYPDGESIPYK